jgi:hypothetical protein
MRIEIRKKKEEAILISFDTLKDKFDSASERNRFFWKLYGRKQVIIKQSGRYEYDREGLLEGIPHIKVASSVFIIAMNHLKEMMKFFDEWEDKIDLKTFPVLLDDEEADELEDEVEIE